MTIRVLEIIPTLVRGGAEKQLALLAGGLPREEFDVHVAVLTHDGPLRETLDEHQIPVTLIGKRWKIDPAAYAKLRRLIRRLSPDIVHTWIFAANSYGRQAAFSAGVKHVVAGERCVDRWKAWYELAIDRRLAARTARIATNSTGVRDFYVEKGLPAEKFVVIPNGIAPPFAESALAREQLLAELDLPTEARLIGAVGRLWPQKRYKDLIWAAELVNSAHDDVHLLIIGDGPQRDRLMEYRNQVVRGRHVHFLGARRDVPDILPHLDCFWLGSGYEGQSNALMEAMAAGIPAVATDIPGNRDLVAPDQTGFLVPVGSSTDVARKTHQLLEDNQLARRLGQAASQRMRDEFSVGKMIDRYARLYRELVL